MYVLCVCMCMYVCMCVYIYICVYALCMYVCVCMRVCGVCVCLYVCMRMYVCMNVCMYSHMSVCMYYVFMYVAYVYTGWMFLSLSGIHCYPWSASHRGVLSNWKTGGSHTGTGLKNRVGVTIPRIQTLKTAFTTSALWAGSLS